ncbi:hypothetical protein ACFLU6_05350 [Acidobacteriota bacterium]
MFPFIFLALLPVDIEPLGIMAKKRCKKCAVDRGKKCVHGGDCPYHKALKKVRKKLKKKDESKKLKLKKNKKKDKKKKK